MAGDEVFLERVHDELRARERPEEGPEPPPGERFLVDRMWPRGVSKTAMEGVTWLRAVAPSAELRTWFGHDPDRFAEFSERYRTELESNPEALDPLLSAAGRGPVTLLYAAKDTEHNHAVVLREYLAERSAGGGGGI
ncbi:DUF488 domain-containing protein [Nocardiopsis kunsanensis]|uniref:DUF488 domain-containing protein n=1 Tax=Nocardiopsis kunsanensis TaxID=141693 RepID=A0A918XJK4_9ACTN|nr:DUF488 family protein [Nocardiopsis kunsanensis]GHD34730.1 hypothetical protein GCM10007147_40580 [Nocardiopsis kunsanensis]